MDAIDAIHAIDAIDALDARWGREKKERQDSQRMNEVPPRTPLRPDSAHTKWRERVFFERFQAEIGGRGRWLNDWRRLGPYRPPLI